MTLIEISSSQALQDYIQQHHVCVVTFSAHWCGPCRASKSSLQALATKMQHTMKISIVYEDILGDTVHSIYHIKAFPTYVLFVQQTEHQRIEGANMNAIEQMIQSYIDKHPVLPTTGGETLGGDGSNITLSPAEARLARLAKLGGNTSTTTAATTTTTTTATTTPSNIETSSKVVEAMEVVSHKDQSFDAMDDDVVMDTEEEQNTKNTNDDSIMEIDKDTKEKGDDDDILIDPTASLNTEYIQTLTETMGFTLLRAQKGLLYGTNHTIEGAIEWLDQHQNDDTIDEPIPMISSKNSSNSTNTNTNTNMVVQSYKCNECGKILSNMANLELHANKTGHSDFEESTQSIQPLTAEEKIAKIAEIKQLLKLKRAEREEAEKVDDVEREIQRRNMGKEMLKTKEQLEIEQRKREAQLRKKEKADFARERQRLRDEIARDKAERASGKGKLSSRLGVDGYKPDGIQYDIPTTDHHHQPAASSASSIPDGEMLDPKPAKVKADVNKIDEYITKVSSYRAGGDGGNCLKVLKTYIGNVLDHPDDDKYKTINMENKAYKGKVKPFIGAKQILLACGFIPPENGTSETLVLRQDYDVEVLSQTKTKLEAAFIAFNK